MGDIYETIWDLPDSHVPVTRRDSNGSPIDPAATVVLDEQSKAGNCLHDGNADRPLFAHVDETAFNEPTFGTFIALLDNYTAVENEPETAFNRDGNGDGTFADATHDSEVNAFLDAVLASRPMQVAADHIRSVLKPGLSAAGLRSRMKRMWFEPFTNRFGGTDRHCTGFEHVFVGEDESSTSAPSPCADKVGGYHSWVKYYLDQQAGKAEYLGHDYEGSVDDDGLASPHVATILFRWSPKPGEDGARGHDLLKKPGGFFVGTRPEFEIAIGTVGMYALEAGEFENIGRNDQRRVKFGDSFFDLVLHPEATGPPVNGVAPRGEHLRTLWPKFRGGSNPGPIGGGGGGGGGTVDLPTQPHNDSPVRIARALPNPVGSDETGEWVELENVTDDTSFNLSNWQLMDQQGREQPMNGSIAAGETRRIDLTRDGPDSMMLRNDPGAVSGRDPTSGSPLQHRSRSGRDLRLHLITDLFNRTGNNGKARDIRHLSRQSNSLWQL